MVCDCNFISAFGNMLLLISSQINTVKSFKFMDFNFHGFVYLIHLLENKYRTIAE